MSNFLCVFGQENIFYLYVISSRHHLCSQTDFKEPGYSSVGNLEKGIEIGWLVDSPVGINGTKSLDFAVMVTF